MELYEYLTADLDLEGKLILDAALGMGKAARRWAEALKKSGADGSGGDGDGVGGEIISVDKELSKKHRRRVKSVLGDYSHNVRLKEADIFDLNFLQDGVVDIINCHDTIIFLNDRPLRLLAALKEFKRVLKPGGKLLITSEMPPDPGEDPEAEGEWKRLTLLEALHTLTGKNFADFIHPDELKIALELLDFSICERRIFPGERNEDSYKLPLHESEEIVEEKIAQLPWSAELKKALRNEMDELCRRVEEEGYLKAPDKFVMKAEL